jgi:ParB family chromosome partitioning protein
VDNAKQDAAESPAPSSGGATADSLVAADIGASFATAKKAPARKSPISKPVPPKAVLPKAAEQDALEFVVESEAGSNLELVDVPGVRFAEIPVTDIHPNRKQPRSVFDEDDMAELVHSVREIGVLQPIVVRTSTEVGGEPYELVMGERRWRAVQAAGLETIPAIVRDTTDDDLLRDALLENLHRSQLNPLEEAAAYQQLLEDFGATHEQLADRIGRSRPQVSNTLRLLKLPPLVQRRVAASVISAGHARALLALPDAAAMERLAQKIVSEGMSVRATEEAVTLYQSPASPAKNNIPRPGARHERLDYLASSLSDRLDTNVKISLGARKGRVSIEFASVEDLNRIMDVLTPGSSS